MHKTTINNFPNNLGNMKIFLSPNYLAFDDFNLIRNEVRVPLFYSDRGRNENSAQVTGDETSGGIALWGRRRKFEFENDSVSFLNLLY